MIRLLFKNKRKKINKVFKILTRQKTEHGVLYTLAAKQTFLFSEFAPYATRCAKKCDTQEREKKMGQADKKKGCLQYGEKQNGWIKIVENHPQRN